MKFSEIKRGNQPPSKPGEPPRSPPPAQPPPSPAARPTLAAHLVPEPPSTRARVSFPGPAAKSAPCPGGERAHQAYASAVSAVKSLLKNLDALPPHALPALQEACADLLAALDAEQDALLALTLRSTAGNYLYAHAVNVAVLSLHLARGLGWSEAHLKLLGLCALLNDLGMLRHMDLAQEPRRLSPEEMLEIRLHPAEGRKLLDRIPAIPESVKRLIGDTIVQVHERKSGKGYPQGLSRSEDILPGAQIIGLCDIYAAISHPRPWRPAAVPHEALKTLLNEHADDFEAKLLRSLLERLSLFPPGSFVQLSSGEVGCVVSTRAGLPTRPCVEVRIRQDGERQLPPFRVDLKDAPMTHIARAVDETSLNVKDPKLALQLQANRWWTL